MVLRDDLIRKRLTAVLVKIEAKTLEQRKLIETGAASPDLHDLEVELQRLETTRAKLLADLRLASLGTAHDETAGRRRTRGRPLRESVLDALEELGQPASPTLLSDVVQTRFGVALLAGRLASMRRDELVSYRKDPSARPAWIVPAIGARGLTAMPRLLTASSWELERRIIGARTLRVIHLKTIIALVDMESRIRPLDEAAASKLKILTLRMSDGLSWSAASSQRDDVDTIRATVQAELAHIEQADLEERAAAATKLSNLQEALRFWGRPALVDGAIDTPRVESRR